MKTVLYPPAQALLSYHHTPGKQPTHVYLAGLGMGSTAWYPSVIYGSELAAYHTLMPDFLGFGYSERPDNFGCTVAEHAASIAFLLDRLQVSQCTVIGHSFGGAVAISLATKRPDLVSRIVLAEPVLDAGDWFGVASQSEEPYIANGHGALMEQWRQELPNYNESDRGWWPIVKLAAPYAFYRTACSLAQGVSPTWREQLYQLKMPRLVLLGEVSLQKKTVRVEDKDELPTYGIQVAVIPHAAHLTMMLDNKSAFTHAIAEFESN